MRIATIGGGPAGLYLSLLMKRADPAHHVTVLERNGPDNTFGRGVAFSDQTLDNLRNADVETHARITDHFAHWDDIAVRGPTGCRYLAEDEQQRTYVSRGLERDR